MRGGTGPTSVAGGSEAVQQGGRQDRLQGQPAPGAIARPHKRRVFPGVSCSAQSRHSGYRNVRCHEALRRERVPLDVLAVSIGASQRREGVGQIVATTYWRRIEEGLRGGDVLPVRTGGTVRRVAESCIGVPGTALGLIVFPSERTVLRTILTWSSNASVPRDSAGCSAILCCVFGGAPCPGKQDEGQGAAQNPIRGNPDGWNIEPDSPLNATWSGAPPECGITELPAPAAPAPSPCDWAHPLAGPVSATTASSPAALHFSLNDPAVVCVRISHNGVSSARVDVNGVPLASPADFRNRPDVTIKQIELGAGAHTASITVNGAPEDVLDVVIAGRAQQEIDPTAAVVAGERGRLYLTGFEREPPGISPVNQDVHFDQVNLSADLWLRQSDGLTGNNSPPQVFRLEHLFFAVSADTCSPVWSSGARQHLENGPHPGGSVFLPVALATAWDGRNNAGESVPDGRYFLMVQVRVVRVNPSGTVHLIDELIGPALAVTVDNTPPPLTVEPPVACTGTTALLLRGTTEGGATVTITRGEDSWVSQGMPDGTWSQDVTLIPDTANTFGVSAHDPLLNRSVSPDVVVIQDSIPPALTVTHPSDGQVIPSATVVVEGTADDTNLVDTRVQEQSVMPPHAFQQSLAVPFDGSLTITVTAVDCAGHQTTVRRTVRRQISCQTSADCMDVLTGDPEAFCRHEGVCNNLGRCEFPSVTAPASFCEGQVLWTWSCTARQEGSSWVRGWTCNPNPACPGVSGCTVSRCVAGLDACEEVPLADGTECAPGPGVPQAACVDSDTIHVPRCIAGECRNDTPAALDMDCAALAPPVDTECWTATCVPGAAGARATCSLQAREGQLCGACASDPTGLDCDRCGAPQKCSGFGLCESSAPVVCNASDSCSTAHCDPFAADDGDACVEQPLCAPETSCVLGDAGAQCIATP